MSLQVVLERTLLEDPQQVCAVTRSLRICPRTRCGSIGGSGHCLRCVFFFRALQSFSRRQVPVPNYKIQSGNIDGEVVCGAAVGFAHGLHGVNARGIDRAVSSRPAPTSLCHAHAHADQQPARPQTAGAPQMGGRGAALEPTTRRATLIAHNAQATKSAKTSTAHRIRTQELRELHWLIHDS